MKVKEFIMKLDGSNQEILNKLGACKSPDEAYDVAKSYGVDESQEVFVAEMTKFYEAIRELDESELEDVAGGVTEEDIAHSVASVLAVSIAASVTVSGTVSAATFVSATMGISAFAATAAA